MSRDIKLKKDCSKCSNYIQEELNNCEEWEVNHKELLKKELETICSHDCLHEGSINLNGMLWCQKCGSGDPNHRLYLGFKRCEKCHKGEIKTKSGHGYEEDKSPCNNPNCGKGENNKDTERERESKFDNTFSLTV